MCGIAACYGAADERGISALLGALHHRGPDSEGKARGERWAMGIRRLSIIDVAGGDQPLSNEDGRVQVVCNGEIYNHATLRRELRERGHTFRSGSDAEVIVHLYEEHGEGFVERLQGMFALFLATPEGCFVARDRLGIKPLYQATLGGTIYYASEIRALLRLPGIGPARTDPSRVADSFLFRYVPEPATAFVGIEKFPAGQIVRLTPEGPRARRYWDPAPRAAFAGTFQDAVSECGSRLQEIVRMHLMSERPVGVFLSGGLDSSVVAALAVRGGQKDLVFMTASFPGSDLDESAEAAEVARFHGVRHEIVRIPEITREAWTGAIRATEDLIADPATIPVWLLSRAARGHLTVGLLGEGSDEVHLGYESYRGLRKGLSRRVVSRRLPLVPRSGTTARRLGFPALGDSAFLSRYSNLPFAIEEYPPLLPGLPPVAERLEAEVDRIAGDGGDPPFARARRYRLSGWMKDDLLFKVDKNTMAFSLEARVPYLDHTYVEWAFGIPERFALRGGVTKAVLRAVAAGLLPPRTIARRQHGLIVPKDRLFRAVGWREHLDLVRSADALWRGVFEERPILAILARHESGDESVATFVYQLLNAELWRGEWLPPAGPPPGPAAS